MLPKSVLAQFGPKLKTLQDLLENFHSRHFEGVEYKSDVDILQFFCSKPNFRQIGQV